MMTMTPFAARTLATIAAAVLLASPARAQHSGGATVRAIVHDSLSAGPLGGATVQIVSLTDWSFIRTAVTDSLGRSTFAELPAGQYRLGFLHPLLEELGVTPAEREVRLAAGQTHRIELAVPSPARLRLVVCGAAAANDSSAAMVGTIRDPRTRMPIAGASVTAQWVELTLSTAGIQQRAPRATATTGASGWFAICGLPSGMLTLHATHAADSTPRLDFQLAAQEFRRRDLYLTVAERGELRGQVVSADSARPLAGARITVVGGAQGEAGATGEFRLGDVPLGTQFVEVRAVGYFPERRAVDVLADGSPVVVSLRTFAAVLDAVRVTAARTSAADLGGFEQRQRRSGMGRYLTAEQIARRNVLETSDLLRTMPGFIGDGSIAMRGNFSNGAGDFGVDCTAEVYIDGHLMRGISAGELDALVKPEHIVGIEVYSAGSPKPQQFDSGMSGCGSLVVWQLPLSQRVRRR